MTTMTIELPKSLQDSIEQRLALSACETAEEYVLKLIRDEEQRQLDAYYEREVPKGLDCIAQGKVLTEEEFWKKLEERRRIRRAANVEVGSET